MSIHKIDLKSIKIKRGRDIMTNLEIRTALKEKRMFNYELAELLGITEFTLSRKLRKELPDDEKQRILEIIAKAR
jgi:hypothetical protein